MTSAINVYAGQVGVFSAGIAVACAYRYFKPIYA